MSGPLRRVVPGAACEGNPRRPRRGEQPHAARASAAQRQPGPRIAASVPAVSRLIPQMCANGAQRGAASARIWAVSALVRARAERRRCARRRTAPPASGASARAWPTRARAGGAAGGPGCRVASSRRRDPRARPRAGRGRPSHHRWSPGGAPRPLTRRGARRRGRRAGRSCRAAAPAVARRRSSAG